MKVSYKTECCGSPRVNEECQGKTLYSYATQCTDESKVMMHRNEEIKIVKDLQKIASQNLPIPPKPLNLSYAAGHSRPICTLRNPLPNIQYTIRNFSRSFYLDHRARGRCECRSSAGSLCGDPRRSSTTRPCYRYDAVPVTEAADGCLSFSCRRFECRQS